MGHPVTEGYEAVPLRFPRPVVVPAAIGLAAAWLALASTPARADSVRQQEWWLGKLNVTQAWHTSQGAGVTVAVLSDGVVASNPDLVGSVVTGPDFTRSGRAASGPYFGVEGTPVASLIAGHGHGTDSSDGIVGVAPRARILSVRVTLSRDDPLLSSKSVTARLPGAIAAGIRYAVGKGAAVIDLPLDPGQPGAAGGGGTSAAAGGSGAERAAVAYALGKGVVLVAPAGDNGAGSDTPNYPAAYRGVISVGAFDKVFMKAPFSSHQSYVTLTAAGDGVIATTAAGSYATMRSTDAASGIVAGIAALIRSRFPELTPGQVRRALTHGTVFRPVGGIRDGSGHGTANADRALHKASVIAAALPQPAKSQAVSRHTPTSSASPAAAGGIAPKVLRAAVLSAGLLVLLLLLIAAYAWAQRRRVRAAGPAPPDRGQGARGLAEGRRGERGRAGHARPEHAKAEPGHPGQPGHPGHAGQPRHAGQPGHTEQPGHAAQPGHAGRAGSAPEEVGGAERGLPAQAGVARAGGSADPMPEYISAPAADPGTRANSGFPAGPRGTGSFGGSSAPARSPVGTFSGSSAAGSSPVGGFPAGGFSGGSFPAGSLPAAGSPAASPPAADFPAGVLPGSGFPSGSPPAAGHPAVSPPAASGQARTAGDSFGAANRGDATGHASRSALGPAPRLIGRQPKISGRPPWAPAAKPDSELSWTVDPAPNAASRRAARSAASGPAAAPAPVGAPWPAAPLPPAETSDDSIWPAADRARRPGTDGDGGDEPASARPDGPADPGRGSDQSSDTDQGGGPIYVWDPGSSTDRFPTVPWQKQ
jgi:hypothetical protein